MRQSINIAISIALGGLISIAAVLGSLLVAIGTAGAIACASLAGKLGVNRTVARGDWFYLKIGK